MHLLFETPAGYSLFKVSDFAVAIMTLAWMVVGDDELIGSAGLWLMAVGDSR